MFFNTYMNMLILQNEEINPATITSSCIYSKNVGTYFCIFIFLCILFIRVYISKYVMRVVESIFINIHKFLPSYRFDTLAVFNKKIGAV